MVFLKATLTFKINFVCFNESPLKKMKNTFHFTLKGLLYLNFCLYLKDKVDFKIHDVTTWLTNNYNNHIAQFLRK